MDNIVHRFFNTLTPVVAGFPSDQKVTITALMRQPFPYRPRLFLTDVMSHPDQAMREIMATALWEAEEVCVWLLAETGEKIPVSNALVMSLLFAQMSERAPNPERITDIGIPAQFITQPLQPYRIGMFRMREAGIYHILKTVQASFINTPAGGPVEKAFMANLVERATLHSA